MIKVVFSVACVAAVFALCAAQYLRRRRLKASSNVCYLQNELKPQNSFKRVLADNSYTPFKHLKLNESDKESSSNLHPYREEIEALLENPLIDFAFVSTNVDLEMSSSYVWVGTESQLEELVDVLRKETVIAVDTEQHSLRSFLGFTALMQISTQEEDYLLDTIALHDIMGILRPVFANPSICKVFHGADNDVLWLQRDFHIYVVNLFDTAKVCDVLSKPQKSLSYLLETYCGVFTNKLLQREDWRQRPLTEEMVQYARTDAHFLLYITNCLINELKTQDIENTACPGDKSCSILEANRRSNMVCLQLYTKEIEASPGDSAASSIFSRYLNSQGGDLSRSFETQDLVRCLCMWRDLMARVHDESLRYVLSDQAIVMLASRTPKTQTEIYDTIAEADLNSDPLIVGSSPPSPSPVVRSHLVDLHQIMQYKTGFPEDIALRILKKHLGPNGSCPLSLYNYSLLSKSNLKRANGLFTQQNGGKSAKQVGRKASRELFVQKFSCKSPVYHNCRIYASDGRLLCYCDRRKLEWYLRRDLAKLVENDPPAIMLLFEPKGRPEDEDNDFYIQSKKNICVGCGEGNHYLRYRLIPSCYRMHFPEHLKSHRSHDIVLLCVDCHEIAHSAAEKNKKKIAEEYGIPLFVRKVVDSQQTSAIPELSGSVGNLEEAGVSPLQLRTAAMALLRHGPKMPSRRREELTQTVMKYFGGKELSERDLERALLVGMSPHERRKLEKKRGLHFEHLSWTVSSSKAQENNADTMSTSAVSETLEVNGQNEADTHDRAKNSKQGDVDSSVEMENFVTDMLHSYADVNGKSAATGSTGTKFDTSRVFENQNVRVLDANNGDEIRPPNRTTNAYCLSHETASPEYNPKMSLLGHGPHGKQVVDHLIKEYGEEGIRQFCQKWRQVFVEAIHPRFLPTGWDVMHR